MAGLYIHIPFCGSRCAYCDFYKSTDITLIAEFSEALKREMSFRRKFLPQERLDTIYVGGGTPSLLSPSQLQGLLDHAAKLWDCSDLREVTLEANPEDLTGRNVDSGLLSDFKHIGFNRLSIGVQSFDDGLLRLMNRRHDAARARQAVRAAQRAGFENITIDLIYGIPGMTLTQWKRTLDEALGLGVQHISAYHLTIEPGTAFGRMAGWLGEVTVSPKKEGAASTARTLFNGSSGGMEARPTGSATPSEARFKPVTEEESERQYEILRQKLDNAGFEHYEISNFALPGRRAVHNSAYWSGVPYLGVGPSAHSFDGGRRREWVVADLNKYMIGAGSGVIYDGETLSDSEFYNERVMTALRTTEGIELARVHADKKIEKFLRDGLLVQNGTRIAIPPEKFLLSDYITASLFDGGN